MDGSMFDGPWKGILVAFAGMFGLGVVLGFIIRWLTHG